MAHTRYKKEKINQGNHQFKLKKIQKYIFHNVETKSMEIENMFLKKNKIKSKEKNEPRYASFIS